MTQTFVIVGGGLAAAHAVTTLREEGFDGDIVLYGDEHHVPYERPPLSKGFLTGADELDSVFVHPRPWYDEQRVDLRLGTAVTAIDTAARTVTAGDGGTGYDRLLVATGAAPRPLAMADESGAPVAYLRTIEDSRRLKDAFGPGRRIAIVGAGWIGLETAAAARAAGADVTVVEAADLPLLRVLGPEVARVFADLHREHGVDLRTGVRLEGVSGDAGSAVLRLADGSVDADLVVVGVGAAPRTALAEAAGLAVDDGILVDEHLAASAPDVFAAGDVARAQHPVLGRRLRVEHWDNAIEQGKAVGRAMMGQDVSYDRMPYFFSDQYDLGLEYVGDVGPDGYDEVVLRGDVEGRVFTALWLAGDRVLAGMHVNDWDAADTLRALVGSRADADRLRDRAVPLDDLAR
ncbi:MAG: NAD(P)/FAD-dependent oxidoreductase [Nocardioides sp.]